MAKKIIGVTVGTPINPQKVVNNTTLAEQVEKNTTNIEQLEEKINDIEENGTGGVNFETDESLKLENGILSVNTTNIMEQDNTLPITSAGVYATVGNIEVLLKTI